MFESFLDDLQKSNPHIQVLTYAADIKNEEIKLFDHKGQEHASSKKILKMEEYVTLNLLTIHQEG
jgi:hypothetical protein